MPSSEIEGYDVDVGVDVGAESPLSDSALLEHVRAGSSQAYAALWERHHASAMAFASSFRNIAPAEDLVAEAYTRILTAVRHGKGPTGAFRAYLIATVRNIAISWGRSGRREQVVEDLDLLEGDESAETKALRALDSSITSRAFRMLLPRWQEVLWYAEIEQLPRAKIAVLLGISSNALSQLIFRAREALRAAWIQAHLETRGLEDEHRDVVAKLGARVRGSLSRRDERAVRQHLERCARCIIIAAEADNIGARLSFAILPVVAGVTGAAHYLAAIGAGHADLSNVSAEAGGSGGDALGIQSESTLTTAGGTSVKAGSSVFGAWSAPIGIAASVALVAGAITGVAGLASSSPPSRVSTAAASRVPLLPEAIPTPTVRPTPPAPSPSSDPIIPPSDGSTPDAAIDPPPVRAYEAAPLEQSAPTVPIGIHVLEPADQTLLATSSVPLRAAVSGIQQVRIMVDGLDHGVVDARTGQIDTVIGPLADGSHVVTVSSVNDQADAARATVRFALDTGTTAPVITVEQDAEQHYLPRVSVTAEPGAELEIGIDGETSVFRVGSSGVWTGIGEVSQDGDHVITAVQTDPAGNVSDTAAASFAIRMPTLRLSRDPDGRLHATLCADRDSHLEVFVNGMSQGVHARPESDDLVLPDEAAWFPLIAIAIRYADPSDADRRGPMVIVPVSTAPPTSTPSSGEN